VHGTASSPSKLNRSFLANLLLQASLSCWALNLGPTRGLELQTAERGDMIEKADAVVQGGAAAVSCNTLLPTVCLLFGSVRRPDRIRPPATPGNRNGCLARMQADVSLHEDGS
jgi:hypothetical protein